MTNTEELALSFLLLPKSRQIYDRVAMVRPVPDLYHYTTAAGLEGILGSRSMWASEARYLNDEEELIYAEQLIRETLLAEVDLVPADYRRWLVAFANVVVHQVVTDNAFFIASLCEKADLLSQWRGYARAGYCIHFAHSTFSALPHVHIVRVTYDVDEQRQIVRDTLAVHLRALKAARETGFQDAINEVSGRFGAQLSLYAAAFKNSGFFEEREWRLITGDAAYRLQHRGNPPNRIPFVEIALPKSATTAALPIVRVIVAPGSADSALEDARRILSRFGYDPALVHRSAIPLRPSGA